MHSHHAEKNSQGFQGDGGGACEIDLRNKRTETSFQIHDKEHLTSTSPKEWKKKSTSP